MIQDGQNGEGVASDEARATAASQSNPSVSSTAGIANAAKDWKDGADQSSVKWPLGGYAPGHYIARCYICKEQMMGVDKRARSCLACSIDELREAYEEVDRAFRIKVWNEAKAKGLSDRAAMDEIVRQRAFLSAKAIEARSDKTGTGLAEGESAAPQGFAQTQSGAD